MERTKFRFVLGGGASSVLCFAEEIFIRQYASTLPEFLFENANFKHS